VVIARHSDWISHLAEVISKPLNYIRYDESDRPSVSGQRQMGDEENSPNAHSKLDDFWIHTSYQCSLIVWGVNDEYHHFIEWWKDPERFSVVNTDT
jgi:hypothetical protein